MSATKAALKATKAALDAHEYQDAIEQANAVLTADPTNYNANVLLGLAYEKQRHYEASETAYRAALRLKDKDPLAWQGLVALYEKQASTKLGGYHDAVIHLAEIFMEKDDKARCQSVVDKYVGDAKKYGSRSQYKRSLEVYLPTGSLYNYLEGRIPQPAYTYMKIAEITEAEEKEKINTEIGQRRTRLGAKIDQVAADVKKEVLEGSQLEELYGAIIDWVHDDKLRRQYEEKLLQRGYDTLITLPLPYKASKREQVSRQAHGLVILKHPFLLAWKIKLEWDDVKDIADMDAGLLREYIALFPEEGLGKVLHGYMESNISPFPKPEASVDGEVDGNGGCNQLNAEDRLILMSEGMEESSASMLAHRLLGQVYLNLDEYESAAGIARQGLNRATTESNLSGLTLQNTHDALSIVLATALIHFRAPRHHPAAMELFEDVLRHNETETSALIGIGLILEEQEDYHQAIDFLDRALKRSSETRIKAEVAWCKALIGDNESSLRELEACLSEMEGSDTQTKSLRSRTLYRVGICMWNLDKSSSSRKDRSGAYARFLASLQADLNFAPSYTSLGVYYADYAKDRKRARKCFQKAFELSSSEVEAAERLARSFATSAEWDLVEVVAQRVIESGKVRPAPGSKKKGISWPFAALGVVQINKQDYGASIVSFQAALRIVPTDYNCWVGLGESYHHAGRYIAATKAFEQAQKLADGTEDVNVKGNWFSKYMLANVKRELGEYDEAIVGYREVLAMRPSDFGVCISLLQSLVEGAWRYVELGFYGRAADGGREAICIAQELAERRSDASTLWKTIGDASSIFTYVQAYASRLPIQILQSMLEAGIDPHAYELLAEIDGVGESTLQSLNIENDDTNSFVKLSTNSAILAQKRAIHACAHDVHARAVAWYNLGWTEHRAHVCGTRESQDVSKKRCLKYLKASVQAFKRAIELEAGNAEFWSSLGVVTTDLNPKVAQHSFIRSLYLNDKNARVWTNLGTLYLIQGDHQLANEAFTRAQSCDPDYAQAWVGQGLLATRLADMDEARDLFTHAFEIADSSSIMIKRHYAVSSFDNVIKAPLSSDTTKDLQPSFALHQLRSQVSSDLAIQHLSSLFAERVGYFTEAAASLGQIAFKLEAEYETSESPLVLMRFAQTKADLARIQLAEKRFGTAAENAEIALNLSEDENLDDTVRQSVRLSAHITAGLVYYYQGDMDQALGMFRSTLEETKANPDVICLLAQVLWAKGGDEERNVAREQLFECVEKHPSHVGAITCLGVIAVLDLDRDTIEAVKSDLQGLRIREDIDEQQQSKVAQLLSAIASLYPEEGCDSEEICEAAVSVFLAPSKPRGWSQLVGLSEESYPAEMAVLAATKAVPPRGVLNAGDLAKAYTGTRRIDDAQKAVMVAPWLCGAWESLL